MNQTLNFACLASGKGSTIESILKHPQAKELIRVIVTNKDCNAIAIAKKYGKSCHIIDQNDYNNRESHEKAINNVLESYNINAVFLCGYMKILTSYFVDYWAGNIYNIHPSILPSFIGGAAARDIKEYGALITGSTIHAVTQEVDKGDIFMQSALPITKEDSVEEITYVTKQIESIMAPLFVLNAVGNFKQHGSKSVTAKDTEGKLRKGIINF